MASRQLAAHVDRVPARQPGGPGAGQVARRGWPRTGVVPGAGAVLDSRALAAALRRATSGRLARAGPALLQLQRDRGNRHVQSVISQARANDAGPQSTGGDARRTAAGPAGGAIDASLQRAIGAGRGGGRALDRSAGAALGQALGADVSHVRVHTDLRADRLSRSLNASAFTIGGDIFFRAGQYHPGTSHGRRLLAHELAHAVQQGASTGAAPRFRVAPANDPAERAADRVAGDVVRGGRAHPAATTAQAPLIQRKAFIGWASDPLWAKPVEFTRATPYVGHLLHGFGIPPSLKAPAPSVGVEEHEGDLGTGERNVRTMVADHKSRYFHTIDELRKYARGETDDIGYVDREKTWVRLPGEFLVLGERHSETTLMDLVEATGTKKYIYEGGAHERPSPYLYPGQKTAEGIGRHALEEMLPKLAVGLIGVNEALKPKLKTRRRGPGWKESVLQQRQTAALADPEAKKQEYEVGLAKWSSGWETKHQSAKARQGGNFADPNAGRYQGELNPPPPRKEYYSRAAAEVAATRKALEQLSSAARGPDDPITRFYAENKEVIDTTIQQLNAGLPVELTRMFLKMATGKFKLRSLIKLMTGAAESELTASKVTDVSTEQGYGTTYETPTAAGQRMEQLRDSYMLDRILAAKAAGDRLAGLGDAHRQNLEGVLKRHDPDILVKESTKFYAEQYKLYPDRD